MFSNLPSKYGMSYVTYPVRERVREAPAGCFRAFTTNRCLYQFIILPFLTTTNLELTKGEGQLITVPYVSPVTGSPASILFGKSQLLPLHGLSQQGLLGGPSGGQAQLVL